MQMVTTWSCCKENGRVCPSGGTGYTHALGACAERIASSNLALGTIMTVIIDDSQIIEACSKHISMAQACKSLGLSFSTFKRKATQLGVYVTNQGLRGVQDEKHIPVEEIVAGKHPHIRACGLKPKLWKAGLKEKKCECCGIGEEWNGKHLVLELDHINGNSRDHRLENLRILCPNCHSQTPTFRGRKMTLKV